MMKDSSKMVLNYMKENYGREMTKQDIAKALSLSLPTVTGSINGLVKKGFVVERVEVIEVEPATETRKAKTKELRHETLTEAGLAFDPEAVEEAE